jgi:dTMP kinase
MFITFEGPEGCGKTSQIAQLSEYLLQSGYEVLSTREPGGTPIGDRIRAVLLDLINTDMVNRTEILLFQASRAQLVEQVIRPHLTKGGIVLCDRYADSTIAYQGFGYQTDLEILRTIVNFATGRLIPDLTILLDLPVEIGLSRRADGGSWNRLDALELAFYERVRQGYHQLARNEPGRWFVINAEQPPDQVQKRIQQVVLQRLGEKPGKN